MLVEPALFCCSSEIANSSRGNFTGNYAADKRLVMESVFSLHGIPDAVLKNLKKKRMETLRDALERTRRLFTEGLNMNLPYNAERQDEEGGKGWCHDQREFKSFEQRTCCRETVAR